MADRSNERATADGEVELGVLGGLVGYHLRRASAVVAGDFTRIMADTGLRQTLFAILSIIAANPGINQSGIGDALGIKRANMVGFINELLDAGLVERVVSPDDRRAFRFTLTDAGERRFAEAIERIVAHEERLLSALNGGERAALLGLLARIDAGES